MKISRDVWEILHSPWGWWTTIVVGQGLFKMIKLRQSNDADDGDDFKTITAMKQKLSLHLSKERKKVLSPSS